MNDPNKRIDVNISSLLSLKAELLRKQDEVNKVKYKKDIDSHIPKKSGKFRPKSQQDEGYENEDSKVKTIYEEVEDQELLCKSKKVLEAKSKFYDKMMTSGGKLNSDDNCLVMFNHKRQDEKPAEKYESSSENYSGDDDEHHNSFNKARNPDEEWVEYTDCLGRTRECMRKDLDFFKKKDSQLADNIQPRQELNQNAPMWMIDTKGTRENSVIPDDVSEMTSMVSKHDQMKMNWEKKEEENAYKENVHYQDVLFDEARTHGVGYYAFATDEDERAKQRKELDATREKTLSLQKEREAQRLMREKIVAERVKAAKNRQRARLGLPPLEDEPEKEVEPIKANEEEKTLKREAKEKRRKERQERKREEERKHHVRPWDKNKLGNQSNDYSSDSEDEWNYKPEREPMSQEQWNEKQRDQRNPEFAPVSEPRRVPNRQTDFVPNINDSASVTENSTLYFTTKKPNKSREFLKRNSTALHDLGSSHQCDDAYDDNDDSRSKIARGAEIPPPPTFEYYGPTSSNKRQKNQVSNKDLEDSIAAGLRYIRERSDKGVLPTKSSWTANADY